MMRFTVTWLPRAENQLAAIWLAATSRTEITDAATQVDTDLSLDAHLKGLEFHEGLREILIGPLMVLYSVQIESQVVDVLRIKYVP